MTRNKKIQISTNFKNLANTTPIRCDKRRIMQVLNNLLTNAIKFTPQKGKIHITIRLIPGKSNKARRKGLLHPQLAPYHGTSNMLEVSVRDKGVGIHRNCMEQLFEHDGFIQSVRNKEKGGIGLGLYICRKIVRSLGGDIICESKSGYDRSESCFTFIIQLGHVQSERNSE